MIIREATKKMAKIFTTVVNFLQKWRTPPPPISQQFQPLSELENQFFFAIIKSLRMRGIDKNKSLKSSSKQTDYEKFSSLWTKI